MSLGVDREEPGAPRGDAVELHTIAHCPPVHLAGLSSFASDYRSPNIARRGEFPSRLAFTAHRRPTPPASTVLRLRPPASALTGSRLPRGRWLALPSPFAAKSTRGRPCSAAEATLPWSASLQNAVVDRGRQQAAEPEQCDQRLWKGIVRLAGQDGAVHELGGGFQLQTQRPSLLRSGLVAHETRRDDGYVDSARTQIDAQALHHVRQPRLGARIGRRARQAAVRREAA